MGLFTEKYRVIQKIGEGSFSEVLKCQEKITGHLYAAKRLKKHFKSPSDAMNCAEVVAMHKLTRHPNVVYMMDFFYDTNLGSLTYVFELMDLSMYDFMKLKRRPFAESRVKWYLYQILKGLEHLHKNGLFHRDIKPENILVKLNPDGNKSDSGGGGFPSEIVKLGDLGSIRGVYSRQPYTEYISTRWYRSPECLLSVGYYGPKMDIWAAGCVFYEMLTFHPLFPGSNEIDQLAKIHAILGSPSNRLVTKIKKKSHNCQHFPRQIGCGLKIMMNSFSEEAHIILKLMLQYDPETRINVRRLIENRYFASVRQYYLIYQFKFNAIQNQRDLERCSKGRGDQKTPTNCPTSTSDQWKPPKFQNMNKNDAKPLNKNLVEKEGETVIVKKDGSIQSILSSMESVSTLKSIGAMDSVSTMRSVSTMIRSAKKDLEKLTDEEMLKRKLEATRRYYVHKCQQTIKSHPPNETYRKTTSNLPNIFSSKTKTVPEHSKQKQFYSKSLVIPRKAKHKIDCVNENWIEKVIKVNLNAKK
ncbi:MAPK/MAK/MRK overlapping kinase-like isoform X1 [Onthophagus taurus]|uniref:MAPK/MAK/MRK overlapping kinase-like isoform X1 n=2 Tax=Onthophagus taurus TaxID=166361 RepID=UPI0039BE9567